MPMKVSTVSRDLRGTVLALNGMGVARGQQAPGPFCRVGSFQAWNVSSLGASHLLGHCGFALNVEKA